MIGCMIEEEWRLVQKYRKLSDEEEGWECKLTIEKKGRVEVQIENLEKKIQKKALMLED